MRGILNMVRTQFTGHSFRGLAGTLHTDFCMHAASPLACSPARLPAACHAIVTSAQSRVRCCL